MDDQRDEPGRAEPETEAGSWDEVAERAHDEAQAVLDAMERRAGKLSRRIRQRGHSPSRILRLLD